MMLAATEVPIAPSCPPKDPKAPAPRASLETMSDMPSAPPATGLVTSRWNDALKLAVRSICVGAHAAAPWFIVFGNTSSPAHARVGCAMPARLHDVNSVPGRQHGAGAEANAHCVTVCVHEEEPVPPVKPTSAGAALPSTPRRLMNAEDDHVAPPSWSDVAVIVHVHG